MKIAVTYEDGMIFEHFGKAKAFKIYEIKEGEVLNSALIEASGSGHAYMTKLLRQNGADALICGDIGLAALVALKDNKIGVFAGASGNCDEAVNAFLSGTLSWDPDPIASGSVHECHCGEECE